MSSLSYKKMWLDENYATHSDVGSWGPGFYLWVACFVVLAVFSLVLFVEERRNKSNSRFDADTQAPANPSCRAE